jgi:cytochrome c peroxidase
MRSATSAVALILAVLPATLAHSDSISDILRQAALDNELVPVAETHVIVDANLAAIGKKLFESRSLSLNGNISCKDCHLEQFGSADGIPNAIGVGGEGEGADRVVSGGPIIPRNTLPLWGRGGAGFDMLFWDGKVDFTDGQRISQFGAQPPSEDPLITAIHLPAVEIREMLTEDPQVHESKQEDVESAAQLYNAIMVQLGESEAEILSALARHMLVERDGLEFIHVAIAIAHFIREEFRLEQTRFHRFVFEDGDLSEQERRGALIFYGKGKCATCHSGPYLTDFAFHAIPFPQLGFGKNGFGVDYGRYNVTHDPGDLYTFRTPPLFNVTKTEPYGHSGSVGNLADAIRLHFDPLPLVDIEAMAPFDRHEFYKRLMAAGDDMLQIGFLADEDVDALVAFLHTLSF